MSTRENEDRLAPDKWWRQMISLTAKALGCAWPAVRERDNTASRVISLRNKQDRSRCIEDLLMVFWNWEGESASAKPAEKTCLRCSGYGVEGKKEGQRALGGVCGEISGWAPLTASKNR
jgi:hypothetical protein